MKILSFDVGIKNLAYCLIEVNDKKDTNHTILDWGIINCADALLNDYLKCCVSKKGEKCNKPAINKIVLDDSNILGFCHLKTCQASMNSTYSKKNIKKNKLKTTKDLSLDEIGCEMFKHLHNLKVLLSADEIVIENQPVLKNPTMKSIQMILYSYFLFMKELNSEYKYNINLFNARKKLAIYDGPKVDTSKIKNAYNKRKYLSVKYTEYFLDKANNQWKELFDKHSKKDDLADCYLQGLTYYYN